MKKEAALPIILIAILIFSQVSFALSINGMKLKEVRLSPDKTPSNKIINTRPSSHNVTSSKISDINIFNENAKSQRISEIKKSGKIETISGTLIQITYDDFENSRSITQYVIQTSDKTVYNIYSTDNSIENLAGSEITIEGYTQGNEIVPSRLSTLSSSLRKQTKTLNEQKLIILLVNWADDNSTPLTIKQTYNLTFNLNNPNSLSYYINEVSYGRASLTGDVYGWVTSDYNKSKMCTTERFAIINNAIAKADSFVDFSKYQHLMIISSTNTGCTSSGGSYPWAFNTNEGQVKLTLSQISNFQYLGSGADIHEFGHQLGLLHANGWECGSATIGNNCQSINYGDSLDIMGYYPGHTHFNAFHKEKLGWINSREIKTISSPGSYTITPLETPGGLKMLKIPTNSGITYSIEFRRPILLDKIMINYFGSQIYSGAIIHSNYTNLNLGYDTQLLDNKPHAGDISFYDFADSALDVNQKFQDITNNIEIKTISFIDENLTVCIGPINFC